MDYSDKVAKAIRHFWTVRSKQHETQGSGSFAASLIGRAAAFANMRK